MGDVQLEPVQPDPGLGTAQPGQGVSAAWAVMHQPGQEQLHALVAGRGRPGADECSASGRQALIPARTWRMTLRARDSSMRQASGSAVVQSRESSHSAACYQHWHVSESGHGYCPMRHGKSLDRTGSHELSIAMRSRYAQQIDDALLGVN